MPDQFGHASGLTICGTGRAVPLNAIQSDTLDRIYGLAPGFVTSATGVATRYFCDTENQIDLAQMAAQKALDDAGIKAEELDLIVSAAAVAFQPIPATAPLIQKALGISDGTCFGVDVNATCLGFPTALQMTDALLKTGQYATALIVASEHASRGLPWADQPDVAGLFGDGAGAAVVHLAPGVGIRSALFRTYPTAYDACQLGAGGTRFDFEKNPAAFAAHSKFQMNGKELFKVAAKHFSGFVDELLAKSASTQSDISCVIAHQASPGALDHMIKTCGFQREQVVNIVHDYGNQIAASIPFVLDHARATKRIKAGDRIAILGTSAGVSFGGLVMDV